MNKTQARHPAGLRESPARMVFDTRTPEESLKAVCLSESPIGECEVREVVRVVQTGNTDN